MPPTTSDLATSQHTITSLTTAAALQVLLLLLDTDLRLHYDFVVNPISAVPPFIVRLRNDLPPETLAILRAAVAAIPDAVMS